MTEEDNEKEQVLRDDKILDTEIKKKVSDLKKFFAELIGTAFLVFVVTGIPTFNQRYYRLYNGAFESSLVLTTMIYIFGRISGAHFNPAVTIPMFLRKKISLIECCYYIGAQLVGAFLGSILVIICNKGEYESISANGTGNFISFWDYFSCFVIEIILTFGLVFVIFASTIKENNFGNLTGFIVGITLYFLGITGAGVSGGSLNPARSIAPAVIEAIAGHSEGLKHLWIYVLAPIIGGICAGYLNLLFE
jgi:aquaporin Z